MNVAYDLALDALGKLHGYGIGDLVPLGS